jgi:large subunit ribosomal protein L24
MAKMKIKKGDLVQVTSGRSQKNGGDRGKQGKVIAVYPRHPARAGRGSQPDHASHQDRHHRSRCRTGGLVVQEAPVHVSNVAIVDPETKSSDPHPDLVWRLSSAMDARR